MAETGVVNHWSPGALADGCNKTIGQDTNLLVRKMPGGGIGVPFPKQKGVTYTVIGRVPLLGALTTGIKFDFILTDDGADPNDLGLVAVLGVTVKTLATNTDNLDIGTGAGTEVTANCTLAATSGVVQVVSVAGANASIDGLAVSGWFMARIRRVGDNASDTLNGQLLCGGVSAYAY